MENGQNPTTAEPSEHTGADIDLDRLIGRYQSERLFRLKAKCENDVIDLESRSFVALPDSPEAQILLPPNTSETVVKITTV